MLQRSTSHLHLSQHLNLGGEVYSIYTILKCKLKSFPFPKSKNLNWITVLFKLLHFGDASNDFWDCHQYQPKCATACPAACSPREWEAALTSSPHSYWRWGTGRKNELQLVWMPKESNSSQAYWKKDVIRFYSQWRKESWSRREMWAYMHAERNRKLHRLWLPPEVILDYPHVRDVTGKNCNSGNVTDCRAVRKRVLSCLLDVCPAGHAHR